MQFQLKKKKKAFNTGFPASVSTDVGVCRLWTFGMALRSLLCETGLGCFVIQMCSLEELTRYLQSYQVQN